MPPDSNKVKFVIHNVHIRADGERVEEPENYIEFVQVVAHVQLFKHGTAGIWINITVGNQSSSVIEVERLEIEMQNSKAEPHLAPAGNNHKREFGPDYLWNEIAELEESNEGWTSMFTKYNEIIDDSFHERKNTKEKDRIFYFELEKMIIST
jgi:hypothetical protein